MDPRTGRSKEFAALINGYQLCCQRLVRLKYEVARAVADSPQQRLQLKEVLKHYLDETSRLRSEEARLGRDTSRLDAILAEGLSDRYEGPLLHGRYRIFGALSPAGKFYIVDYQDADLISSGSEDFSRLDTLLLAQQGTQVIHNQREKGTFPMTATKPRLNLAPTGKHNPKFSDPAESASTEETVTKKILKGAKSPKVAKDVRTKISPETPKERKATAGTMFKELILAGQLTDDQIFAAVQKEYGLDDGKRGYVKWYRNDLKKKGSNPPEALGAATVKLPKNAGLGEAVDLDKAETPVLRQTKASFSSSKEGKLIEAVRKTAKETADAKKSISTKKK